MLNAAERRYRTHDPGRIATTLRLSRETGCHRTACVGDGFLRGPGRTRLWVRRFEGRALFQLKFYALVLWRTRGVVPKVLRLLYLKDAEVCDYSPDAQELERFERTLVALSQAVERAKRERDFRPQPSRLCGWCSYQRFCPEFGGTPPPYPEVPPTAALPVDPAPDDDRLA